MRQIIRKSPQENPTQTIVAMHAYRSDHRCTEIINIMTVSRLFRSLGDSRCTIRSLEEAPLVMVETKLAGVIHVADLR